MRLFACWSFNLVNQSSKTSVVYIEYIRIMYPKGYTYARDKLEYMGLQKNRMTTIILNGCMDILPFFQTSS